MEGDGRCRKAPSIAVSSHIPAAQNASQTSDVSNTVIALFALLIASAAPSSPQQLAGIWAGDGFGLRPARIGYVVQGKCAAGKITGPVFPDRSGTFAATGYFNRQTSGYRLSDIAPRDQLASFKGKISGNTLVLIVRLADRPGETRYVLKRGAAIKFPDCS
ncbi:hypothetical protein [Sandarakinorhabdus sp.]|uniref:hypothetical protein n=1 Tax=Sandarakinorhabdus sp. TaxID=1916663 RepID=UPI00286E2D58|nr:hypothetical protein [Sandarakinorhabdus sp.]